MMHRCIHIRLLLTLFLGLIISTTAAFGTTGFTGDTTINSCETKTYTLDLQNTSGNPLTDLVLTAKLASLTGFSYVNTTASIDINGGGAFCTANPVASGTDLIWDIDSSCPAPPFTLNNGDTLNITFDLATDCLAVSGSLNAQVDYQISGTPMTDDTAVLNIQVNPGAVTIKKTLNVIPQVLDENVTWTLTVENTGFGVIKNVEVTDELDVGLAYVSSSQNGNNSGQTTTWTSAEYPALASMDPGDIWTMDITATVISCDNLDNKADVRFGCAPSPAGTCFNTAVDGGTANASVQRIVRTPVLSFTPPDINFTYCDDTQTVAFTIINNGDGIAYDVYTIVDFSAFTVSNVSAGAIYNVAQGRFELAAPIAANGGTYNLSFDLTYNSWCGSSFPSTELLWQKLYKDECGQEFYPQVELSTINAPASSSSLAVSKSGAPSQVEIGGTIIYTITSSYTGQLSCDSPSSSVGVITVEDTIPNGLTVTDAGGGVWVPGGDGTGGTITWTYTPPASLNTTITVQVPDDTQCETYCNTLFTNTITASGTDCCGCALSASASQTTAIECAEGVTSDKTSTSPSERCTDTTYTNTYTFSGGSAVVLSALEFTEEGQLQQEYVGGSLSVIFDGNDITGSVLLTDNTPTLAENGLVLDFSGSGGDAMAGKTLTITYDLTATANTVAACSDSSFYSWSRLNIGPSGSSCLGDGVIHETTEVNVGTPAMDLNITGLGQIYNSCETKTITMTLNQTSDFNPKDVKLKLEGLNYFVVNPGSVGCGGSVAPVSCTPVIDGGGDYIWTFNDGFAANGANAVFTIDVQKRCTGGGALTATAFFDDACTDDATPDELCSVVATETPALLLSADLLIEKTPETYFATTDTVQWEIYLTNRGTGTAYNVWVDDILGSGLQYQHGVNPVVVDNMIGVTINDSLNHLGGAINGASIEIASMAAGERRQITFIAKQINCTGLTNDVIANWGCIGVNCQTDVTDSSIVKIPAPNLINTNTITPANGVNACEAPNGFITLRNAGQIFTYNLQVTETLPPGLLYISGSTRWRHNGGPWNGPNVIYDPSPTTSPLVWTSTEIPILASAAPGDTIEIEFEMSADCPFAGGDITVATQYENPCADVFNTSDSNFIITFNEPDITITKTRADDPVGCNEAVSWTIDVTNNSGYTLDTIWVEDTLDAAYTWTGNGGDGTYSVDAGTHIGQRVQWELDDIPHGATATLTIDATTDSSPCSADLDNTVDAWWGCGVTDDDSSTKPGVDPPDDTLCLNGTGIQDVRTETRQPDLSFLEIKVSPTSIDSCLDSTTLTVVLDNSGPVDAINVDLEITLPAGLTYNAGTSESGLGTDNSVATAGIGNPAISGSTLTWYNIGDKAADLANVIQADGGADTLVLKFDVQSACYITDNLDFNLYYYDCCNDTQYSTTTQHQLTALYPSLTVTKTPTNDQVSCAAQQPWTITVTNNGTGNAQVVRVEDTPGAWIDVDIPASTPGLIDMGGNVYGWEFNDLAASGGTQSFTVVGTLNPDGSPNQNDCTTALRQNNAHAVWACGTAGDAIDNDPSTTAGYTCEDATPASAPAATLELPNLVVTSITPSISCTAGDGIFDSAITVRVTNIGDGDTSGLFTVEVTDGKGWTGTGTHSNAIASGAFADVIINTATWNPTCPPCGAPYSFLATVDLDNDICECNETDNDLGTAVTLAALPDLEVNSITPSCSDDGLSQVVVNIGNVGCTNISSSFTLHLEDDQGNSDDITINSLNNGANTDVTFTNWPTVCSPASITFTATVDYNNDICECDNVNSLSLAYTNPLADLTVSSITPTTTCALDGSVSGTIDAVIVNNGNGAVASDFQVLADDGQGWTSELWYQADLGGTLPLASGGSDTVSINWARGFTADPQVCSFPTMSVTVDSQGDICECNSGSNILTTSYTVPLPDLEVTAVTPGGGCPLSGTTVSVANTGCGDAADVVIRLTSDCGLVFDDQTITLAAGETQNLLFPFTAALTSCSCNFSALIDPDVLICELDGTNNSGASSSVINIPDLEVVSSDVQIVGIGDGRYEVNGEVTLVNNGCGSALTDDISMRFSVSDASGCGGSQLVSFNQIFTGVNLASSGGTQTFTITPQQFDVHACTQAGGCQYSIKIEADYDDTLCEWNDTNNDLCSDIPVQVPDLTITGVVPNVTCDDNQQAQGIVTVDVANNGCGDVLDAVVDLTSNCGTQYGSQNIDLVAGTVGNVVFQLTGIPTNCLDFVATIDSANNITECSGNNNELGDGTSLTCEVEEKDEPVTSGFPTPSLILTKTNSQYAVLPGSFVDYTIKINNIGSTDAINQEVSDTLPTAMLYAPETSALNGSLIADPVGERILTWTVPLISAGESVSLTYRTVVKSDARPGRHTNTAQIPGLQPASASLFINDPDKAQCCLQLEKKMVSHDIWPDSIRVEPDLYFQTDMAMYASAEFVFLNNQLGPWLEAEGLDHDPTELVTGIYRRMVRQADWYAHFNLGNFTMGSGFGLSMENGPDVLAEAKKLQQKPSDIIAAKLAQWADESGLNKVPQVTPLLLEYFGGAPLYAKSIDSGHRAWGTHNGDMGIVPSAWGLTLLRQSQAIQGRLQEDNFMRQVTSWQMAQKVKWIRQNLTKTVSTPVETDYLPHRWILDSGQSLEQSDTQNNLVTLTDDSSQLLDQASALWGLSAMRAAFKQNSTPQPEELVELIEIVWQGLENIHLDQDSGSYINGFTFESGVDKQDEKSNQTTDHYRRVQPASLMILALALEDLIRNNDDLDISSEARHRLKELQSFVVNKMVTEQGAGIVYDLDTDRDREVTNEQSLVNQFALLRILLIQPPTSWLQKLRGNTLDTSLALKMFDFAEKNLWDNRYGIYRDNARWDHLDRFSPLDIGVVVGALRELVQQVPVNQRIMIMNRLTATFEKLVNRSEMQLTYMRRNDPDRPLPASIETSRKKVHPLPLPPRRNNISEGLEHNLMDLAPVLIRTIHLHLAPPEVQEVIGDNNILTGADHGYGVGMKSSSGLKQRSTMMPRRPFQTATGSLGSRQLLEASALLSQVALKADDAYLFDPTLGKHFAANLAELTRAGLIRLTMHSGNGMVLRYAKSLDLDSKNPKESLQNLFDQFARQQGLEATPLVSNPIALEYSYGSPQYRNGLNGGWEERLNSPMISIGGLAQTMLHQLRFIHLARIEQTPAQNDLDKYLASIAELQVKAKVEFLKELMNKIPNQVPETVRLVVDSYGYPLDIEIENPDGSLLTQVSLLQAFGELAFMGSNDLKMFTDGQALVDLARLLFEDQWKRTMVALDLDNNQLEPLKESSLRDMGLALDAIARLHQIIPEKDVRKNSLTETGNRLTQWILAEQSGNNGQHGTITKEKHQLLVADSADIIGLLHWYDVTKSEPLRTAALEIYGQLIQDSWDPDLGIFHNAVDQTFLQHTGIKRYHYSDLDISLTLSGLIHILPYLESSAQRKLIDRLIVFGNELLQGIDLEVDLFENNRFDGKKYDIELIRGVDLQVTDRKNIYPGEIVTFSIHVKNSCFDLTSRSGPLHRLTVKDQLPISMAYIVGSSRIDKQRIDPLVTDFGELSWNVKTIAQEDGFIITFDAKVLEEIQLGDGVNTAWAEGWMEEMDSLKPEQRQWSCQTGEDRLIHTVGPTSTIKGKVFVDTDHNGRQGATEIGFKGINLLLNGRWNKASEENGGYRYDSLRPGSYDIRLDWSSLPDDIKVISDPAKNIILEEGTVGVFNVALLQTHNIEATLYHDKNDNGLFDAGESGVPATKIGLKNSDQTAYSAKDGFVRMDSIPVGIPVELIILKEQPCWDQQQWKDKKIRLTPWHEAQ